MGVARGMQTTPWEKSLKFDCENPLHRNLFGKLTVKMRDLGKTNPFKIHAAVHALCALCEPRRKRIMKFIPILNMMKNITMSFPSHRIFTIRMTAQQFSLSLPLGMMTV
jgi:hypothetical protein